MGLLDSLQRRRVVARAHALAVEGKIAEALEGLELRALLALAEKLSGEERLEPARAVARRALELAPDDWEAAITVADLDRLAGDNPAAIASFRRLNAKAPSHEAVARYLAEELLEAGEAAEAFQVLTPFAASEELRTVILRGKVAYAAGDLATAVQLLRPVLAYYDQAQRSLFSAGVDANERAEVLHLFSSALSETEGQEQLVVDAASRRDLDYTAGVNYRLLAAAQMVKSGRIAHSLELLSPAETDRVGQELLEKNPEDPSGLCQRGIAALRQGDVDAAQEFFGRARRLAPDNFAALAGYGASLQHRDLPLRKLAKQLPPEAAAPPSLLAVVPDWPALTELERRVVQVAVHPFRWFLPELATRGAKMRILPLDVRVVDRPEFADLEGVRHETDHRAMAGIGGLATHGIAAAKIEELLELDPDHWTFAHEFAHLVHLNLPETDQEAIVPLFERASESEFAVVQYQLNNELEFFAVAYTQWLWESLGFPSRREADSEVVLETFALLDELSAREEL